MHYHRPSNERGQADHGWLKSKHSFSFANYYDPNHMQFGPLRVINEDRVAPGKGFDAHPHHDMEIISYVVEGTLEHRDSMGQISIIKPGDVQRMSAGTGIQHSEYNASQTDPVHFLQIWIMPEQRGLKPSYAQRHFEDLNGQLRLVASKEARDGAISINADVDLYASKLVANEVVSFYLRPKRGLWVQLIHGSLSIGQTQMQAGDGLALSQLESVDITACEASEFILFDVPLDD